VFIFRGGKKNLYYCFVLFSAIPEVSIMYGDVICLDSLTALVIPVTPAYVKINSFSHSSMINKKLTLMLLHVISPKILQLINISYFASLVIMLQLN